MKKAVALILAMFIMTVSVFADVPEFFTKPITNYTSNSSISITFDSSEDIIALFDEVEVPEEVNYFVDLKSLLKTLLSYEGNAAIQADMSDDYKKINMGLIIDSVQNIDVNTNLKVGVTSKTGMWIKFDLSAEEPVCEYIYSLPMLNKYFKINLADYMNVEEFSSIMAMFDKEFMDGISKNVMGSLVKYADIQKSGTRYTVKLDNDGFTSLLDEVLQYLWSIMSEKYEESEIAVIGDVPSVKGWKLLGDNGFVCTYTTRNGNITKAEECIDISVDISEIYTALTGEEWYYNSKGLLDFTITSKTDVTRVGNTKVTFPILNAENTIDMASFVPQYEVGAETEYLPEITYPNYYVSESCSKLMVIDGDVYVPLRQTLEAAYDDTVTIGYNNGTITAISDYFAGFKTLTLNVGSDKIYADGKEYSMGNVIEEDGVTYVNSKLFSDIFGWELSWAEYNILDNWYHYTFYTE